MTFATMNTDGGARGNPGQAAIGIILKDEKGEKIKAKGHYLGIGTNNEAEYMALLMGLELALELDIQKLECRLDSELVVKQLNGAYKVKMPKLRALYDRVKLLSQKFANIQYVHVHREQNSEADKIVNEVLDNVSQI